MSRLTTGDLPAGWLRRFPSAALNQRRLIVVVLHLLMIAASNYAAFWVRYEGAVPRDVAILAWQLLPALMVIRAATFIPFRLYEGLWRYTSIKDLWSIVGAVAVSSGLFYALIRWGLGFDRYPRSIYLIDALFLVSLMAGVRSLRRVFREAGAGKHRRVLVYGAGDAGEMIVRDMRRSHYAGKPIGFVDDDPAKVGERIHGLPVFGTRQDLPRIVQRERPDEVLIAMPSAAPSVVRAILAVLRPYKLVIKTLPNLREFLECKVFVSQIRTLAIEDLLPRAPVGLDDRPVKGLIAGRTILVTGAGGSIGSELCRQILSFGPRSLVLFERYENSLFEIENDLRDRSPAAAVHATVGDTRDRRRVEEVLAAHRPDIVFHAAAHKHVPLMEHNPCEAVKNNVEGTWILARAAIAHRVSRFVMISTDKAVNPTSVMGASKRVAESIVQALSASGPCATTFSIVRFGNVLNSNGSVIPRFLAQIRTGGPVTVTHPRIRRYFMLIPEAVQLVLQAATIADSGDVLVLDMGEQLEVLEVARNLIRLAGYLPDEDIPIVFTGLRPGEKLYEELVGLTEQAEPAGIEQVTRIRASAQAPARALTESARLIAAARRGDRRAVLQGLHDMVPTYAPASPLPEAAATAKTADGGL